MASTNMLLVFGVIVLFLGHVIGSKTWVNIMSDAMDARDSILEKLDAVTKSDVTTEDIESFIDTLQTVQEQLEDLGNLENRENSDVDKTVLKKVINPPEVPVSQNFKNGKIEKQFSSRGLGSILKKLNGYYNGLCINRKIHSVLKSWKNPTGIIPVQRICKSFLANLGNENNLLAVNNICESMKKCSWKKEDDYSDGTNVKAACADKNACDVKKALPMMTSLLWYRVSNFIAQFYCSDDENELQTSKEALKSQAKYIQGYASTLHWESFKDVVHKEQLYRDWEKAISEVKKREKSADLSTFGCHNLESEDLCDVNLMYNSYVIIEKLRKERKTPGRVRDIRMNALTAHTESIEERLDTKRHNELLGEFDNVKTNIFKLSKGLSTYFKELASYDEGIAQADDGYISGELEKFKSSLTQVSAKLSSDIKEAMGTMDDVLIAKLAEETATMAAMLAEMANPLVAVFGGVEPGDLVQQAGEIAKAARDVNKASAIKNGMMELYTDSRILRQNFADNAKQIKNLKAVVDGIIKGDFESISADADLFIREYGGYTPKVSGAHLEKNDALWGAFKGSICDFIESAVGVGSAIIQRKFDNKLLCEKLEGTIAEYSALRQNIFDFQFDLVDTLAKVVRANIAKKRAQQIKLEDQARTIDLITSVFTNEYQLQLEAAQQCDRIEYRLHGQRPNYCKFDLLTRREILDAVQFNDKGQFTEYDRTVLIPTRPSFDGDTGFIDFQRLINGEKITFKVPRNTKWLIDNRWLLEGEQTAMFVRSFKLFLPLKKHTKFKVAPNDITVKIKIKSVAGSSISSNKDLTYLLPTRNRDYTSAYKDFYSGCRKQIKNPYSLCNNLPDVCDTVSQVKGESLTPTILSTWNLQLTSGYNKRLAPKALTDFPLVAKLKLRVYPGNDKRSNALSTGMTEGCCKSGKYRDLYQRSLTCIDCPKGSKTKLGGWYCQLIKQ